MNEALWYLGRGTGLTALLAFTASLWLGVLTRSGREALGLSRFTLADLHRVVALTGTGLVVVHVVTLLLDPYSQLRVVDLLVPFAARYRPLYLGLGTLAVDILLVVVASSLLRQRLGPRTFKAIHWGTYVLWPFAFVHSLGAGTDASARWFTLTAVACAVWVAGVLLWRLSKAFRDRGVPRVPRSVVR
jgi:predicted ferric reductase